jgi:hypothetical protein
MYLSKTSGSLLPGRGLINPAFVIKIVPATDNLQQQPSTGRDNPTEDYHDNLKVGNEVKGRVGKKTIVGKVERIIKNELGDCIYVMVSDPRGKSYKIEASQIEKTRGNIPDDDRAALTSSPALFNESDILSFEQFHQSIQS